MSTTWTMPALLFGLAAAVAACATHEDTHAGRSNSARIPKLRDAGTPVAMDADDPQPTAADAAIASGAARTLDASSGFDAAAAPDAGTTTSDRTPARTDDRAARSIPDSGTMLDDDAGPTHRTPPRMDCFGKPGAPGNHTHMYNDRAYIVHVPAQVYPDTAVPIMFVFHGAGGHGADMQNGTGFDVIADQEGFVTVYPDGAAGNAPWNVGRGVCPPGNFVGTNNDDVAYFDAMLDAIEQDQCLDRKHVFVTGFSMGGFFSHELGCRLGNTRVRAIAPHSGGTHTGDCVGTPLPVLILHGDSDSLINYRCGQTARDYWVDRNGCSAEVDTLNLMGGHCDFNRNCPKDGQVVLCTFSGLDHNWAFPPMYDHSSWVIWAFFKQLL